MQKDNQDRSRQDGASSRLSTSGENENSRFTFVLDNAPSGTRNHAMRVHWSERRKAKEEKRRQQETSRGMQHNLAPKEVTRNPEKRSQTSLVQGPQSSDEVQTATGICDGLIQPGTPGFSTQLLTGLNHALASSRLDPFDVFPIKLSSQHHKLIHHWLATHATMMFENMPASSFNPMRDVWFPLDLSNAASFNAIMAHSAAHLAHYYGGSRPTRQTNSSEALRYKTDTVKILNEWFNNPKQALSNDTFAVVVRLLTFERYWGTENEWKVHRNGLRGMIEARGGLHQLHSDWRLELVVGLICLMSEPSWFDSTNDLSAISENRISNSMIAGSLIDLQKLRCLWLISFIQDMRNLVGMSSELYMDGLSVFPSLYDAVLLLRTSFELEGLTDPISYFVYAYDRLTCLFAISVTVQESVSLDHEAANNALAILDMTLQMSREFWETSVRDLRCFLHNHFVNFYLQGAMKMDYVVQMTGVVSHLSLEAHLGIEKCLLNILCRTRDGKLPFFVDDGGTPDSLLSTVHGH